MSVGSKAPVEFCCTIAMLASIVEHDSGVALASPPARASHLPPLARRALWGPQVALFGRSNGTRSSPANAFPDDLAHPALLRGVSSEHPMRVQSPAQRKRRLGFRVRIVAQANCFEHLVEHRGCDADGRVGRAVVEP